MRIAVCLSGQPRSVAKVWHSLYQNLVRPLECDVFIHTSEPYQVEDDFWTKIRPKKYSVEPQFPFPEQEAALREKYFCVASLNSYLQQIHGYRRAWELKEEPYDLVIRTRPDLEYLRPITLDMFDPEKINILPRAIDPKREQCGTDVFFIGPDHLMKEVFNVFDWVANLTIGSAWTQRLPPENVVVLGGRHCPETIMATMLEQKKVPCCYTALSLEDVIAVRR